MAKIFSKALMMSEDVKSYLTSVRFQANNADAPVDDGSFVVLGDHVQDTTYGEGRVNPNGYFGKAPAALTDKVAVIDLPEISEGTINGNDYKIGIKTSNLTAPAGRLVRARKLALGDKFWLGSDNFTADVGENGFGILTANDVRLTPAGAQGANFAVKIIDKRNLTIGQHNEGMQYLVEVVGL